MRRRTKVSQGSATTWQVKNEGRLVEVEASGAPHGTPVFLLHGTPGSRRGPKPRGSVLYRLGVRLICHSRPGYGGSTRKPDRTVADAASDVLAIADDLGLDQFAVVGRSGGGPHALACAALIPERVARTAVLVSVAPADAIGLDWYLGMSEENIAEYTTADADTSMLLQRLRVKADRLKADPESMVRELREQMSDPDRRVVDDIAIRRLLTITYQEALKHGPYGWIDDVVALRAHWGFSFDAITGPVRLWHGANDTFSPVSHTHWLAKQISHAEVRVQSDTAHFGAVEILPEMLPWLTAWDDRLVPVVQPANAG